jgi:N-acylglucosamine-6-phosphate 2-epimerase
VKVDGPEAVRAVKAGVPGLPVLAVRITDRPGSAVRITATVEDASMLVEAGADVVELEADSAARAHDLQDVAELINAVVGLGSPVKAGVGSRADAVSAVAAGVSMISSSTMGYPATPTARPLPDLPLVAELIDAVSVPVVAERGFVAPDEVVAALELGAYAVVVGSAIVDPAWLTRRFVTAAERRPRSP